MSEHKEEGSKSLLHSAMATSEDPSFMVKGAAAEQALKESPTRGGEVQKELGKFFENINRMEQLNCRMDESVFQLIGPVERDIKKMDRPDQPVGILEGLRLMNGMFNQELDHLENSANVFKEVL